MLCFYARHCPKQCNVSTETQEKTDQTSFEFLEKTLKFQSVGQSRYNSCVQSTINKKIKAFLFIVKTKIHLLNISCVLSLQLTFEANKYTAYGALSQSMDVFQQMKICLLLNIYALMLGKASH